jgi:hypothetical protein
VEHDRAGQSAGAVPGFRHPVPRCIAYYRNYGPIFEHAPSQYATLASDVRAGCAAKLRRLYDNLIGKKTEYEAASSPAQFAAAPLAGPITMRSIGAGFDYQREPAYFTYQRFPDDFELMIYLATASASVTLPFKY